MTIVETILRRAAAAALLAAAAALPAAPPAGAADDVLHIYNWADYIGETTIADFEKETGIKVVYDTYDSSETLNAKIMAGSSGYDLVIDSGNTGAKLMRAGTFLPIDKAKLKNYGNLDPALLKAVEGFDPGNTYGVPYMWGTTGVAFNTELVKKVWPEANFDTLDFLFKPENADKLAECGLSVLESPTDMIPMVLSYLGKDPDSDDPKDYEAVVKAFEPIRKDIKTFDSENYLNALPSQEVCVAFSWSGDYATAAKRAVDAGSKVNLDYRVPKTGSPAWFDLWLIPKDAKNPEAAMKFIDFVLRPEVIAAITNFTNYANAVPASNATIDKAILDNPAIYPDAATMKLIWTPKILSQAGDRARTRAWSKVKTGQ